jgi:hypothetical protein
MVGGGETILTCLEQNTSTGSQQNWCMLLFVFLLHKKCVIITVPYKREHVLDVFMGQLPSQPYKMDFLK